MSVYSGYLMKRGLLAPLYRSGLVMRPPCLARQFIWSSRVLEQLHLMDVGGSRRGLSYGEGGRMYKYPNPHSSILQTKPSAIKTVCGAIGGPTLR